MKNEKKFYDALERIFVGAPIEGEGGYVNLLKIKEKYYRQVVDSLKIDINSDAVISESFKEDFYNLLFNFFEKYFSECGSVYFTKTANWQKVYEKVYSDNKDVVLFWKTNLLYYVKSDILFQSVHIKVMDTEDKQNYVFFFDVGDLRQKQNNEKKELVFAYKETNVGKVNDVHDDTTGDKTFVLTVEYKEGKKKTDVAAISLSSGVKGEIIEKAINAFKKQTTVDFFINKNAKAFLEEQLDIFLHQLLLEENSEFIQERLTQLKAVKTYAKKLISFIAQFEDELVKIWNKPKFVRNSNYVISIDKLTNDIIEKIRNHANLSSQIEEWQKLALVDDNFSFSTLELSKHPHLPIDTKYFKDLELGILALFDNLDDALDGYLVHSENYQALNTLQGRFKNQIKLTYIDPPFNTGKDFDYIDGYQDSTWLSIIKDRLELSHKMLNDNGGITVHLDRYANYYARVLLNNIFGKENYKAELYWDTCGDTGFKTSKNNWYQNTNCILQYAKDNEVNEFNKQYTLLSVKDPNLAKNERKDKAIGWLDIQKEEDGTERTFVEQWINGVFTKRYIDFESKVDPVGMIWKDVLSFLYTQVGNNESYFFKGGQKPEHLMARIIQSQTRPGDFVMDFFSGIGTTVAVSHKLNRKYLGVEMGEHFNTFYDDGTRVGILGRMKNVLNGDSTFYVLNPDKEEKSRRTPQLTRQLGWQGGGFFKYYSLEQYEDVLDNADYLADGEVYADDVCGQYVFFADEKLSKILEIKEDKIKVDLSKLYDDIDLPESISMLYGKAIERITTDSVKLKDISEPIKYNVNNMNNEEKIAFVKMLKPFIWWGKE